MSQLSHKSQYLVIDDVVKRYRETNAVNHVSLTIHEGEVFSLLGPSGCGKTTLLRIIAGFCRATSGDIRLQGRSILTLPPHQRDVVMMFQQYALFPHMTVAANIAFGMKMHRYTREQIRRRVDELLELVRMENLRDRQPSQLSGGQQQRVALARALAVAPKVLLLDEPLSALDKQLREDMQIELRRIQRQFGITMVFVTHDQEEALMLSDRIGVMNHGQIEQIDTCRAIYEKPSTPFVAQFVGKVNSFRGRLICDPDPCLQLDTGIRVPVCMNEQRMDSECQMLVRPEHTRIITDFDNCTKKFLVGTVQSKVFVGTTMHIYVTVPNTGIITAYMTPIEAAQLEQHLHIGAQVGVSWEPEYTLVFEPLTTGSR